MPDKRRTGARRRLAHRLAAALAIVGCGAAVCGQEAVEAPAKPLNTRLFRSCLGINTHFWQNQPLSEMDYVEDIGATWIRDEALWEGIEVERGVYNTSWAQKWIDEAHRRGLKIIAHAGTRNRLYENPFDPDAYARCAAVLAKAVRGKVQAYHTVNEPYGPFLETYSPEIHHTLDHWVVEGESQWRLWIEKHSELVRKTADAIHEVDPNAIVLPEGVDVFSHPSDVFFAHHRWMFEAGLGEHVSGLTVHPYTGMGIEGGRFIGGAPPEITALKMPAGMEKDCPYMDENGRVSLGAALQKLRDDAKKATGRDVDVWINEWGYPPHYVNDSHDTMSAYLVRMYLVGFANNARIVAWHNLRDQHDGPYGLLDNAMKKRPTYFAYKTMSRTIGDLYLLRHIHGAPMATKGVQAYLFGKDDRRILVVWNIDNAERAVKVGAVEPEARIVDIYGKETAAAAVDGAVQLTVDGKPQYIVGVADAVSLTDETVAVAAAPMPKPAVNTELTAPAEIPAPVWGNTLTLGRKTGRASVKAADESLILDSEGLGFVGLNFYDDGDVSLARGGGNVGVGTSRPDSPLHVRRSQDATTFLEINNPYPRRGPYEANAGTGIKFTGYRDYPHDTEAARIESKYISGHPKGVVIVGDLRFHTSATWGQVEERMRITYEGDVGIGTESPASKLEVSGNVKAANYISTVVTVAADETAPDVAAAGVLVTSANTKQTAIAELKNASVGQTVRIIGGSDTNPSTIADGGKFSLSAPWTANKNDVLTLLVLAADNYVELGRVDN